MRNKRRSSRRKMTVEEIFEADHYRSIIILTDIFGRKDGLRQLHYRWALIKNHDNMKHSLFVRQMQDFFNKNNELYKKVGFNNRLEQLYAERIIIKDRITSNSNLSNFLNRLTNPPYNILERSEEKGFPNYILTDYGKEEAKRWQILRLVKGLHESLLEEVEKAIWEIINKKVAESITIVSKDNNGKC